MANSSGERGGFKRQCTAKGSVRLTWESLAELLDWRALLLLTNLFVFLLVRGSTETLPWEPTTQEIHEDVTKRLKVITTGLLAAQMRVDGHVTSSARERFPLTVRDVHLRLWVTVVLSHTKV